MFADVEALSKDLEKGIGVVEPVFGFVKESMRLRTNGLCGIASLAIQHHLTDQGIRSDLILSQPAIAADPHLEHAFLVAEIDDYPMVIDPTYSQLLSLAGMSEGYVAFGGVNLFPDEKIAAFPLGLEKKIAADLAAVARTCIEHYQPIEDRFYNNTIEFDGLSKDEIAHQYSQFWNPDNFQLLTLPDYYQARALELAEYIDPNHARIIA